MKKLLTAALLATTVSAANAVPSVHHIGTQPPMANHQYEMGYRHGKNHAYHHVAAAAVMVGFVAFVGMAVYQYNEQSRWGLNEKGLVYRF